MKKNLQKKIDKNKEYQQTNIYKGNINILVFKERRTE